MEKMKETQRKTAQAAGDRTEAAPETGTEKAGPSRPETPYSKFKGENLGFMIDFLLALGVNPFQYGKMTDSPNNYETQLRKSLKDDDMKVTKAYRMFEVIGYKLEIDFAEPPEPESDSGYALVLPSELTEQKEVEYHNENLRFLEAYMRRHKIRKTQLARDIGVSAGAVMAWLKVDDMLLSHVNMIRKRYGLKVIYKITEKTD